MVDFEEPAVAENHCHHLCHLQKGKDKGKARARARANLIKEWVCPSKKKIGRIYMAVPRETA